MIFCGHTEENMPWPDRVLHEEARSRLYFRFSFFWWCSCELCVQWSCRACLSGLSVFQVCLCQWLAIQGQRCKRWLCTNCIITRMQGFATLFLFSHLHMSEIPWPGYLMWNYKQCAYCNCVTWCQLNNSQWILNYFGKLYLGHNRFSTEQSTFYTELQNDKE